MLSWPIWLGALLLGFALPVASADMPEQAARGRKIFFDDSNAKRCALCHQLGGEGRAVGPDLTRLARLSPKAIVVSINASRTVYAQEITLKGRRSFPAMVVSDQEGKVRLYDLSKMPPEELTLDRSEIYSIKDNASWRHPPESTGYTDAQLADLVAYIRWMAYRDTKGVDPSEVK
ncbi:MAG: c-type cytochrome [Bryobacteraceae bacterium]|nr:c-type cytochrome [Bryobacteraceae bacterium]MDW8376886.1 c-type cytochrome [Bryobacterales bacterium]